VSRALLVALALVLLPGCGHERTGSGSASLWVTRDRGATVLATTTVPAGLTAMQALDRELDLKTTYGGRFVQSIEGIDGDASKQRDWFWFLNGIEADRSAADYRLHAGDVEWWDFRHWTGATMSVPVVVGAFPEPFIESTTTIVPVGVPRSLATAIADEVHGVVGAKQAAQNVIVISSRFAPDHVRISRSGDRYRLELGTETARQLAANVAALRFQYGVGA